MQMVYLSTAKQGDNVLSSVRLSIRPSLRPFVCPSVCPPSHGCVCNQLAYADNCADAVKQLLICKLPLEEHSFTHTKLIIPCFFLFHVYCVWSGFICHSSTNA